MKNNFTDKELVLTRRCLDFILGSTLMDNEKERDNIERLYWKLKNLTRRNNKSC